MSVEKIRGIHIRPSAAFAVPANKFRYHCTSEKSPEVGDVVFGRIKYLGQHRSLENCSGRIHQIQDGRNGFFVFGNRYAPDYYEGLVPEKFGGTVDLLARSGLVGNVICKSSLVSDPTQIELLGYMCDSEGAILNTRNFNLVRPKSTEKKEHRAKMVLCVGTSMNSGKSAAAAACCRSLSAAGHIVRASKITGTASLKDILLMEDCGAGPVSDFTHLGFPSTYLLSEEELLHIFNSLDLKYANNPKNYWVVEIADGLLQSETAFLLTSKVLKKRIHKLVFAAHDAFGAIGGLDILQKRFGLVPDAISGVCSSSPLAIRELSCFTKIPIFDSLNPALHKLSKLLV